MRVFCNHTVMEVGFWVLPTIITVSNYHGGIDKAVATERLYDAFTGVK